MFRKIFALFVCVLLFIGVLHLGNRTLSQFGRNIGFRNPIEVYEPLLNSYGYSLNVDFKKDNSQVKVDAKTNNNEKVAKDEKIDTSKEKKKDTKENNKDNKKKEKTSVTKDDIDKLIANIRISKEVQQSKYNRDDFEKPYKKYNYNGKNLTRNKYAWHISKHLKSENPFSYICPYTGIEINDMSSLDYDHIVSLKAVYENCPDWWTSKEMNYYAYDQLVGIDVLNTSNRSKSAKTPHDWLSEINTEKFCFTYLVICYEYDIAMSKMDIDVCKLELYNAISSGNEIDFINQFDKNTDEYSRQQKWWEDVKNICNK